MSSGSNSNSPPQPMHSREQTMSHSGSEDVTLSGTTFTAKASSTPSSPQDVSECDSSAVPTPASSSAPDSPMSVHHTTIEVPVLSSGGGSSSSLLHPPTILLEIPSVEYGKCLSPIKEVPTPCPSPAPTPLMLPRRSPPRSCATFTATSACARVLRDFSGVFVPTVAISG
ncbi:hypothetical protein B566_EDAN007006 [Ephemera danica]|nr:hypothetical protein B566_EDAN007006 [Ephemera danica]